MSRPCPLQLRTLLAMLLLLTAAVPAWAEPTGPPRETIVAEVTLNGVGKGTFFALRDPSGELWLQEADLVPFALGLGNLPTVLIDGERYLPLSSIPELKFSFDEASATVALQVDPARLPAQALKLKTEQRRQVRYPRDTSFFLNYALQYQHLTNPDLNEYSAASEVGYRRGRLLLISDGLYRHTDGAGRFQRLLTRGIYDDRPQMTRLIVGDTDIDAGPLGGQALMAGVSYAKLYSMDARLRKYPGIVYAGIAETPLEVEIYADGVLLYRTEVAPGPFEITDLTRFGGAGTLEIVTRDRFGKESREMLPFYVEEDLLKPGFHEYSYHLGARRHGLGGEDDRYEGLALAARHDYGWNDQLTLGYSGEAGEGFVNLGLAGILRMTRLGSVALALAGSEGDDAGGFAQAFDYGYRARIASFHLGLRNFSRDYTNLASDTLSAPLQTQLTANLGFTASTLGSLTLGASALTRHNGDDERELALGYNRRLIAGWRLYANLRYRIANDQADTSLYLALTYAPWRDHQVAVISNNSDQQNAQTIQWQKQIPEGEGYGYRIEADHRNVAASGSAFAVNPFLQVNGRHATLKAETDIVAGPNDDSTRSSLELAGALVHLGRTWGLTRPVRDSYSLVKVGNVEGVRVYRNSQLIGQTGRTGELIVPDLHSFYENQVSISDQDIPFDFALPAVSQQISPPYRSGSCVLFVTERFQPVVGYLHLPQPDGTSLPLEFVAFELLRDGATIPLESGRGGEFYLEPKAAATEPAGEDCERLAQGGGFRTGSAGYQGRLSYRDRHYRFDLTIPARDDLFIDLGKIILVETTEAESSPTP